MNKSIHPSQSNTFKIWFGRLSKYFEIDKLYKIYFTTDLAVMVWHITSYFKKIYLKQRYY